MIGPLKFFLPLLPWVLPFLLIVQVIYDVVWERLLLRYDLISAAHKWVAMCDLTAILIFLRMRCDRTTLKKEV